MWINQLQWKRWNLITQSYGSARCHRRHARPVTAAAARAVTFSCLFKAGNARADGPYWEGEVGAPPRSIQFGVRKMDGFLPKDTEFMSLERFLVNRGEKWKGVKMKTKWEEMRFMRPHACTHKDRYRLLSTAGWMWDVSEQCHFTVSQMRSSVEGPITFSVWQIRFKGSFRFFSEYV